VLDLSIGIAIAIAIGIESSNQRCLFDSDSDCDTDSDWCPVRASRFAVKSLKSEVSRGWWEIKTQNPESGPLLSL